jgi:membrane protease YdiL (CAAX protease family)
VEPRFASSRFAWLGPHLRGHVLLFERGPSPGPDPATATRLVLVFLLLEAVLGPRLSILNWLGLPAPAPWIRVPVLIAVALLLVRFVAGLTPASLGLRGWRSWSRTERSYFIQTLFIGNAVFILVSSQALRAIASDSSLWGVAFATALTQLAWGAYQELVYRGILQTALVSRLGPASGILIANTLFTFGPLHFHHFASGSPLPMFAGIFAIGLFFSLLFWRSGNLWIVGILHGIGDAYIDGLQHVAG